VGKEMLSDNVSSANLLRIVRHDVAAFRGWIVFLFVAVSSVLLALGFVWPKTYQTSTSILIDEKNIVSPLMEGTAVPTEIRDRSKIAEEVIFSRKIMSKIVEVGGWTEYESNTAEYEQLVKDIEARTTIKGQGPNLLVIGYSDPEAERTYAVASAFANLFVEESLSNKVRESKEAFEFIDGQANQYHDKLVESERKLKEFRSGNLDIRPGSQAEVVARIGTLRDRIDTIHLDLTEAKSRSQTLRKQLSGEARLTGSLGREAAIRERLATLQSQLEELQLRYHATYPDIISLELQRENLQESIAKEKEMRNSGTNDGYSHDFQSTSAGNPLYEDLRSQLADTETTINTLTIRFAETQGFLKKQLERAARINEMDASLTELTRDYEVHQSIYEDLARRRENARVSMTLDQEEQGYTLRIQEMANLPITPIGFRFMHFALGGLILGLAAPSLLLFGKLRYDPRLRLESDIIEQLHLPVLSTVPHYSLPREKRNRQFVTVFLGLVLAIHLSAYTAIGVFKYLGLV